MARLEAQVSELEAQLKDARMVNSALAAQNLGISIKNIGKSDDKSDGSAPYRATVNPVVQTTSYATRIHRKTPPISSYKEIDQHKCPDCGHDLSNPTYRHDRIVEDVHNGRLVAIQHTVIRRYCRNCRRQASLQIPEGIPKERFGINLMSLEVIMKMHGIPPHGIIRKLINIIYHTNLAKSTVIHHVGITTRSLHPIYEDLLEEILFSENINGDETS